MLTNNLRCFFRTILRSKRTVSKNMLASIRLHKQAYYVMDNDVEKHVAPLKIFNNIVDSIYVI